MDNNNHTAPFLTMLTGGFWLMQKFFHMANEFTLANAASLATIFSGVAGGSYYIYLAYKKWKNDRVLEKDNKD